MTCANHVWIPRFVTVLGLIMDLDFMRIILTDRRMVRFLVYATTLTHASRGMALERVFVIIALLELHAWAGLASLPRDVPMRDVTLECTWAPQALRKFRVGVGL